MKKLPQITLLYWVTKIVATTLGETGGDLLAQTMKIGYLTSSLILFVIFVVSLVAQMRTKTLRPGLYWSVILTTSMVGTTMADFMDRTGGLGYAKGSAILIAALVTTFVIWKRSGNPFNVTSISTVGGEALFWTAILISNTLGTAFGDFLSDTSGLTYAGAAAVIASSLLVLVGLRQFTNVSRTALFWFAFVLTRPLGATVGDFFSKPTEKGGLGYGTIGATAILGVTLAALVAYSEYRDRRNRAAEHSLGWADAHQPSPAGTDLHLPHPALPHPALPGAVDPATSPAAG